MIKGFQRVIHEEIYGFDIWWQFASLLMLPIPRYTGGRVRTRIMRWFGFHVGPGTMIWDTPLLIGDNNLRAKLTVGDDCLISIGCYIDLAAPISIGNHVGLSPETMLLTGDHQVDNPGNRVGMMKPRPISICDGAWLGARCIILPGVTVGEGAVIGAGAVVTKDVSPHTLVAGVPAVFIRELPRKK